jgi:tetratricopeptide (TPR) repeat protein
MQNPRSWQALTALSTVYLELGASEMAAQSLEKARLINPQDPSIFATLGEIYWAEREYELAYDAYRNALDLDPSLQVAAIGFGNCCTQLGRYAEDAKVFAGLVKQGSRSLIALAALAGLPRSLISLDVLSELKKITPDKNANKAEFENSVAVIRTAALDRAGRPQEAWQSLVPANRSIFLARQQDAREVG